MLNKVRRLYVEKKKGFNVEASHILEDLKQNLNIAQLESLRLVNCYDIAGILDEEYENAITTIFSEPNVDNVYKENIELNSNETAFGIQYIPGQFDQRADSASQCIQILTQKDRALVTSSKIIVLKGNLTETEITKIKKYLINPVDSQEASLNKPETIEIKSEKPENVQILSGFINKNDEEIENFRKTLGLAMSFEDIKFCQEYFRNTEKREPTITEIKVIDTYWSDHCRHTTFLTKIENVEFEEGSLNEEIKAVYKDYLYTRKLVYENRDKDICLMDMATIAMKKLRKIGKLQDLDVSDEINACSIVVPVDIDGETEEWLVMFKNETHNHPTEIEPFGGAATCLGGAIRDPLSGRAYVYQAMRITGSGDPRTKIEDTIPGKLPQRKITIGAAHGYSSYGNQIGLATGQVAEIYDNDYMAKRMEIGAVIAATPKENVVRKNPVSGDVIILVGGRTGRDGVGGATGSSKEHTEESILVCGAEVQKGNAPTERKIQRLFRNPDLSKLIKKCNDFGAGGVSVAIGELADSLEINLDKVLKKYDGLDGTELALSESQERMAVVIDENDVDKFIELSNTENLEATIVAKVTDNNRLKMFWRNDAVLDISRDFLNTNGVKQKVNVKVINPDINENYFDTIPKNLEKIDSIEEAWVSNLKDLNVCSQKGLVERFDSTIGASTVNMPFGGKYQLTPSEGMAAKIPVLKGNTNTSTLMTYGYDPKLSKWSPFHGAMYAVIESVSKIVAMGGNHRKVRLTFQEYFEKLGEVDYKWGKPFSALLGAYVAQDNLNIAAIGGKDSMSGTFNELNVPPTLVSFAVSTEDVRNIISPEFKNSDSKVVTISIRKNENEMPDFDYLNSAYDLIHELIKRKKVYSAHTVRYGGIAAALSKMCFGNKLGINITEELSKEELFKANYGSIILELDKNEELDKLLRDVDYKVLGVTTADKAIKIKEVTLNLDKLISTWEQPLNDIFPIKEDDNGEISKVEYSGGNKIKSSIKIAKPRVLIPVFPGSNCEYDTSLAFEKSGGITDTFIFRNIKPEYIEESIDEMVKRINNSQIIALPGGFSAGDEPDGSGKFIATIFRNQKVKEAVMNLLYNRDGLMIGICNGFQALIKLGLLPYGEIRDIDENSPTLTFNKIGRHISTMAMTKVASNLSPWFNNVKVGDIHRIAMSHGEGRFVANEEVLKKLIENGQICTQYVDHNGNPSNNGIFNPNGSVNAIEGITSPDGRIIGKMGHSERIGNNVCINVPGEKDQKLFKAGISYFG